ncbi:2-oxo-3-hexenedioate decarboxylase [Rhodococcus rhodochrous J3]|uniref:2-oxo-3-hexenedioate decarboxylase n=1 Tax=Rhodococcus rhodochrous J3 TaxID=903528 RepID=A0ABY1MFP7_RHORH|nr:2-oxo-3-hexenedioate decarboxylase [Rhodococcus rhodochrous J3]
MTEQLWSPAKVADVLIRAEDSGVAQTSILAEWDGLDLAAAYEAQDIALQMRISRGERVTGVKLGVTSKAKQRQVGVDSPSTAWLTDAMILPIGEPVPREKMRKKSPAPTTSSMTVTWSPSTSTRRRV